MADGLRYQLAAKTGYQRLVVGDQIGQGQFQKRNREFPFKGKFIEYRGPGRKGPHNFALGHFRKPAGLGNDVAVRNQTVSGSGDDFFNDRLFIAEAAAEQGNDRHMTPIFRVLM